MRIYQLSRTNIAEIREELDEKESRVKEIEAILKNRKKLIEIVRKELEEVGEKYGDKRFCKLVKENVEEEYDESLYVVEEDVFAIVTNDGWLKRIRQNNELSATRLREGDSILNAHELSTRDHVVFFTNQGSMYVVKVSDFPSSSGYGDPVQKFLKFKDGEKIIATFPMRSGARGLAYIREGTEMFFLSRTGLGFRGKLEAIEGTKRSGKRVMKVREGDEVIAVTPAVEGEVILVARSGSGLRIKSSEIPEREGASLGVSLLSVRPGDSAVSMVAIDKPCDLEVVLSSGSPKTVPSKDVVSGKRALKGNKIVPRGEIVSVKKFVVDVGPSKGEVIH